MTTGDQDRELGRTGENRAAQLRTGRQVMLGVVDHQQARHSPYVVDDLGDRRLRGDAYAERSSQGADDCRWIIECADRKPVDSIREFRWLSGGVPHRNPGLADSGWSQQCQESSVITFDELGHLAEFLVSADRMISKY